MKTRTAWVSVAALAICLTAGGVALANNSGTAGLTPARADNFRLTDNHGFAQDLRRLVDVKAIALVAQVTGDAGSLKAAKSLEALKAKYPDVAFFLLNSSAKSRDAISAEAAAQGISVPVLHDNLQLAGEQLGVTYAGEAFLIEPKTLRIMYHGPVEASSGADAQAKGYLAEALADVAAGKPVRSAQAAGKGTPIHFPERDRRAAHAAISYANDVAPILEAKCVTCHQQGGIGPFAMSSYEAVKNFAPMIREAIRTRTMPPWHPDPAFGKFDHDGGLSDDQVRTIVHWIEAGAPRGAGADPLSAEAHVAPDWPLGKPDLVIEVPAYTVPASGVVDYQYTAAANPQTEARWVKAATLLPGDRQATHHILSGYMPRMATGPASSQLWEASYGEYAVGGESLAMPKGTGIQLPAGGAMGFQMHYTPYGKEAVDKSKIGFYFYPKGEEPERIMRHFVIANNFIEIPPGDDNHKEVAYATFPKAATLHSVFLHTHYRGRAGSLEMLKPDGTREMLISLPRYDFNWQRTYAFSEPVKVPAGAKIIATYWYDNSVRNPANPDPKQTIVWGPQSWEEMHYTSLYYQWDDETVAHPADATAEMKAMPTRMMGALDRNFDGKVQKDELPGRVAQAIGAKFDELDANKSGALETAELGPAMRLLTPLVRTSRSDSAENPTP